MVQLSKKGLALIIAGSITVGGVGGLGVGGIGGLIYGFTTQWFGSLQEVFYAGWNEGHKKGVKDTTNLYELKEYMKGEKTLKGDFNGDSYLDEAVIENGVEEFYFRTPKGTLEKACKFNHMHNGRRHIYTCPGTLLPPLKESEKKKLQMRSVKPRLDKNIQNLPYRLY